MKKLNSEWIQAQQTGENRTSKERVGWKTAQQKQKQKQQQQNENKNKQKSRTQKRARSPMTPLREENRKKEATRREKSHRKHEKGENDIKRGASGERPKHKPPQMRSEVKGTLKVMKRQNH